MNVQTKPNIASINGINDGVNQIFQLFDKHFSEYVRNPADREQLNLCCEYIHQLGGLLEMLELGGPVLVSQNIEKLSAALLNNEIQSEPQVFHVLKQASNGLHCYLNELVDGIDENPMRLFPIYSKLMEAQGQKSVAESDLFFSNIVEDIPLQEPSSSKLTPIEIKEIAKQARTHYQAGLLKWLRNMHDGSGLQQMLAAARQIECLPGTDQQRIFWWVAVGFLEGLLNHSAEADLSIRRTCGKIEQEMRRMAETRSGIFSQLEHALIYQIVQSNFDSERVREIKRVYTWPEKNFSKDTLRSSQAPLAEVEVIQARLDKMRNALAELNQNWREFSDGRSSYLELLPSNIEELKQLASQVQCRPLTKLISIMGGTISYLHVRPKEMNNNIAMEMATSLLMVENVLDDFYQLPPEFSDQVEKVSVRLRATTTGKLNNPLPDIPGPIEVEYKTQEKRSQMQASQEMLANLRQIEGILDRFFIDASVRTDLPSLLPLFKQVSGMLAMLDLERANTLLHHCQALIEKILDPQHTMDQSEQMRLVDGLSSLGFFVEALNNTQPDSHRIIEAAIALFEVSAESTEILATEPLSVVTPEIAIPELDDVAMQSEIDPELLDVFLTEANEVLAEIETSIQACREDHTDHESLTALRRGYHTLKGSGRMVHLEDMSEVAWNMEQVLNRWLSEGQPATPELLDLAAQIQERFLQWCQHLRETGTVVVHAETLLQSCKKLIDGEAAAALATIEKADEDCITTTVSIGDIVVPNELFEIFTLESKQHLAAMRRENNDLSTQSQALIDQPFILAAHTLTSISRTINLSFIADLGFALEQFLMQYLKSRIRPDEAELQLIENAVELLDSMLNKIYVHQLPEEANLQASASLSQTLNQYVAQMIQPDEASAESIEIPDLASGLVESASTPTQAKLKAPADKLDYELFPLFVEEADELVPQIGSKLRAWRILPQDEDIHRALLRLSHTLKGGANTVGAAQLGNQIHHFESDIGAAFNAEEGISESSIDHLEKTFDEICVQIEQLQHMPKVHQEDATELPSSPTSNNESVEVPLPYAKSNIAIKIPPVLSADNDVPAQKTVLRVNAELIDHLINESGESSIIRSKIEAQLYNFKQSLQDLTESVSRLHEQLREVEIQAETQMLSHLAQTQDDEQIFDPLEFDRFTRFQELTRLMAESVDDVETVQQGLQATHAAAEEAVAQQAVMNRKLQQSLLQIRTISFGDFSEHYYRLVRQVARETDKKASLQIQGEEVEIDRSILERMNSPLEHLLRNAVVHGVENAETRLQLNKTEIGQITMSIQQENNQVIIMIKDDGAGLDISNIRKKAIQLGLIQEKDTLDDNQIMSLIYAQGLTTAQEITEIAGRGVGMDIVKNEITALGGHIEVSSEAKQGVTFQITIPLTLAISQAMLIRAAGQTYAVPSVILEQAQELNADEIKIAYRNHHLKINEKNYPFAHLSALLGLKEYSPEIARHNKVLLLHSGTLRLAIHIDELIGNSEVVVKNTGPQLVHAPGIEGATIMGDGEIIYILNPVKLILRKEAQEILNTSTEVTSVAPKRKLRHSPAILVVDDSLTVRKVTGRLLEREGCEVLTAKNGLDAIELLRETIPDVILVDLEMPRMNGFELIRHIRLNPETEKTPVIIISSRTADKHREMAKELGVNVFLGKPYKEEELLGHIANYMQASS